MHKITFGGKGYTLFASSISMQYILKEALTLRGHEKVTSLPHQESIWSGAEYMLAVSGPLSPQDPSTLIFLTDSEETAEKAKDALGLTHPDAILRNEWLSAPE